MNVITTPNAPKVLPFAFNGAAMKSGEVAAVPPTTMDVSSAPGSSARSPIFRCSRNRGTQSQKTVEPTSQTGTSTIQPVSCNRTVARTARARTPVRTKKKMANSPWSASDPTLMPQARA